MKNFQHENLSYESYENFQIYDTCSNRVWVLEPQWIARYGWKEKEGGGGRVDRGVQLLRLGVDLSSYST